MKSFVERVAKYSLSVLAAAITLHAGAGTAAALDLDTGSAPMEVVIPTAEPVIFENITGGDASLFLRYTSLATNAWFDGIAPYTPNAVGVYSNLGRRPASEGVTNRNKNIAILYASYRVLNSLFPKKNTVWRGMITSCGLDPDDASTDITTPIGIGNVAGNAIVAGRENDGMNQLGNEGGRTYNLMPYSDTTGYAPVNTAYEIIDPRRWQPLMVHNGEGIFRIQQMVTPQWAVTQPYSYDDPTQFRSPTPIARLLNGSGHGHGTGWDAYKAQVDQVLTTSAGLTDHQKMIAELFNHKLRSLGFAEFFIAVSRGMSLDEFVFYDFMANIAGFDGGIPIWQEKIRHDAIRPFSAIKHVYGDQMVSAWGGPGKGTVSMPASEWKSYLPTPDYPEYPSGSSCFCAAYAQASRRFLGSDNFGFSMPAPAGSSTIEPGITPATDIVLGPWATFTDFALECGLSRNYGGVHFLEALQASRDICTPIGDLAYEFVQAHIDGTY